MSIDYESGVTRERERARERQIFSISFQLDCLSTWGLGLDKEWEIVIKVPFTIANPSQLKTKQDLINFLFFPAIDTRSAPLSVQVFALHLAIYAAA